LSKAIARVAYTRTATVTASTAWISRTPKCDDRTTELCTIAMSPSLSIVERLNFMLQCAILHGGISCVIISALSRQEQELRQIITFARNCSIVRVLMHEDHWPQHLSEIFDVEALSRNLIPNLFKNSVKLSFKLKRPFPMCA
jgi:hypothetical protein